MLQEMHWICTEYLNQKGYKTSFVATRTHEKYAGNKFFENVMEVK